MINWGIEQLGQPVLTARSQPAESTEEADELKKSNTQMAGGNC